MFRLVSHQRFKPALIEHPQDVGSTFVLLARDEARLAHVLSVFLASGLLDILKEASLEASVTAAACQVAPADADPQ